MTMENMNEPTGVLKTIPRGPELMKKTMNDFAHEKKKRDAKAAAVKESASRVPLLVVGATQCNLYAIRKCLADGAGVDEPAPDTEGGWCALQQ